LAVGGKVLAAEGCRVASVGGDQRLPHAQPAPVDPWQDTAEPISQAGSSSVKHV